MWDSESESVGGRDPHHQYGSGALSTTPKQGLKTDGFEQRGQSWFVTSDIPSDLLVQIGDVNFHLHTLYYSSNAGFIPPYQQFKYPLISRSGKLNRIIYEYSSNSGSDLMNRVILDDLPGGADAFELAAKFCYGIAVDLTASNISGLRCASEYLEMTEDLEEGNLIFKTEAFLSYVVLSSWRDSIIVLKSCEHLSPWAENLQIVRRCSESIAWKACANPKGIRWAYTGSKPPKGSGSVPGPVSVSGSSPKWNITTTDHTISPSRSQTQSHHLHHHHHQVPPPDWWFEDVSILRIDHFVRVITAIKVKGMRPDLIGASIMHYASKWLPAGLVSPDHHPSSQPSPPTPMMNNMVDLNWKKEAGLHLIVAGTGKNNNNLNSSEEEEYHQARDQRMIIESLISIIPPQKDSVTCSFLLRLLRMANMLKVAPALVTELEKRVGMQFEQATLADLLVPCYNNVKNTSETTLYDTDLMRRLLDHFLVQEQTADQSSVSPSRPDSLSSDKGGGSVMLHELLAHRGGGSGGSGGGSSSSKARVARIVDSYLTEVAKDRNLSLTKFLVLAEALPQSARSCDDGLYRAIDSYLKAHPTLSEHERKRLCRVMDCQKLSVDACMHAAQNERLPLRIVVQVIFSEQVKISNAIANGTINEAVAAEGGGGGGHYQPMIPNRRRTLLEGAPQSFQEGWAGAKKDINTLKFELETVKTKYVELQNEMENLQRQFDKLTKQSGNSKVAPPPPSSSSSGWASGWKKLSKFTKMSTVEGGQEVGTHGQNEPHSRKTARRWRNSIS